MAGASYFARLLGGPPGLPVLAPQRLLFRPVPAVAPELLSPRMPGPEPAGLRRHASAPAEVPAATALARGVPLADVPGAAVQVPIPRMLPAPSALPALSAPSPAAAAPDSAQAAIPAGGGQAAPRAAATADGTGDAAAAAPAAIASRAAARMSGSRPSPALREEVAAVPRAADAPPSLPLRGSVGTMAAPEGAPLGPAAQRSQAAMPEPTVPVGEVRSAPPLAVAGPEPRVTVRDASPPAASGPAAQGTVRIGTIEVSIEPPRPAAQRGPARGPLSRGYASFGWPQS